MKGLESTSTHTHTHTQTAETVFGVLGEACPPLRRREQSPRLGHSCHDVRILLSKTRAFHTTGTPAHTRSCARDPSRRRGAPTRDPAQGSVAHRKSRSAIVVEGTTDQIDRISLRQAASDKRPGLLSSGGDSWLGRDGLGAMKVFSMAPEVVSTDAHVAATQSPAASPGRRMHRAALSPGSMGPRHPARSRRAPRAATRPGLRHRSSRPALSVGDRRSSTWTFCGRAPRCRRRRRPSGRACDGPPSA